MTVQQLQQIRQLQAVAPLVAAAIFALSILLLLVAIYYFRRSRTDFYWRRRRTAGQRGWRLFVASLILILFSGTICLLTGAVGLIASHSNPTPTPLLQTKIANQPTSTNSITTPTLSATELLPTTGEFVATQDSTNTLIMPLPAITELPTMELTSVELVQPLGTDTAATDIASISATESMSTDSAASSTQIMPTASEPTRQPTRVIILNTATFTAIATDMPTRTPTGTATPTKTMIPPSIHLETLESSVTPHADAQLRITAVDTQISGSLAPVAPATQFKAGFNRIYYFVTFSRMQNGVLWRRQLLLDNQVIEDSNYLWGLAQEGNSYFFFGRQGGFKPGTYEIRLYIGQSEKPTTNTIFIVQP